MTALARQFPNFLTAVRIVLAPLTAWFILMNRDLAALLLIDISESTRDRLASGAEQRTRLLIVDRA